MSLVRNAGNKSTELRVEQALVEGGIEGWTKHPKGMVGKPDFYFPEQRLAVFVDGCFWHACPTCGRLPKSRTEFWHTKIDANRRRDNRLRRQLRKMGYRTMRVWEHELKKDSWVKRLRSRLNLAAKLDTPN
jgi:DNA mismatch endonuclease (patch repair protein)